MTGSPCWNTFQKMGIRKQPHIRLNRCFSASMKQIWNCHIRITGISPLRGSLRAVSGSTIIILAVIAYMRSCLMVCDGILAPPSVTLSKAGGSWRTSQVAITRTDVSVLAYSIFKVLAGSSNRSLYLYMEFRRPFCPLPGKKIFCCRQTETPSTQFGVFRRTRTKKIPLLYMKWERPFLNGFAAPDWKVGLIVAIRWQ